MTVDGAVELFKNAVMVCGMVIGPALAVALVMGLVVGVLQAATQVNESSIAFLVKLLAVGATLAVLGSWSMQKLVDYTSRTIASISNVTR
ncbi:MAG TPA: flagellar biosynthetic protein FliQ [Polyangiaceae bacterium]|nr:flagellar biosynthetic protein FliQ [Polyangiaceae bacterium]